jgi:photosystem II stability/assembly factor-like uncharacterized protein
MPFQGTTQVSGTTARLQAISAVDRNVVWASGLQGTVLRTQDAGAHWSPVLVPNARTLQFRDVHAFDSNHAFLLSAGDGDQSRIFRTTNGGRSWDLQFVVSEPTGFLDCFDFWDPQRGLAYGDSVNGELYILKTIDGGASWERIAPETLPSAGPKEGGFAASGGCVQTLEGGHAWIGTGAGGNARVLRTSDYGDTWHAAQAPIVKGESAGIMAIVPTPKALLVFGGDLANADASESRVARSADRGATWTQMPSPSFTGAIYGAATSGTGKRRTVVALGPKGVAISNDGAKSWSPLDARDFWSIAFGAAERFWVVGPEGAIVRFDKRRANTNGPTR